MKYQIKTKCPSIEQVRRTNGRSTNDLDKEEGIDKRLHAIHVKKAILEHNKHIQDYKRLRERNKKLKRKSSSYSLVIRLVNERDIYFGENPDGKLRYFFSYATINQVDKSVMGVTEYFASHSLALHRMVQVQQQQLETIGE